MLQNEIMHQLSEVLGEGFAMQSVSGAERQKLAEAFETCGDTLTELLSAQHEPLRVAHLLRTLARSWFRFAGLAEGVGANEMALEVRDVARSVEILANEVEGFDGKPSGAPFVRWW